MKTKRRIAVLFGGQSSEYGVSLLSAAAVLEEMNREKYELLPLGITRDGRWYLYRGSTELLRRDEWCGRECCVPAALLPDRGDGALAVFTEHGVRRLHIDAVFPVMHGRLGEDGTVQGLIALSGVPLIGCGTAASAVCMNKHLAHTIAAAAGADVPKDIRITPDCGAEELYALADGLGYPLYVKPVCEGSSHGVSRVTEPSELEAAVKLAFGYDGIAVLEEEIRGAEVGCAVLDTKRGTITGAADEVELSGGFFDTDEKYSRRHSKIHVPARFCAETTERIRRTAVMLYKALGCSGFARVDMFLTAEGRLVFNEINTIPGLTEHSRFPKMLSAVGLGLGDALDMLIEYALEGG